MIFKIINLYNKTSKKYMDDTFITTKKSKRNLMYYS